MRIASVREFGEVKLMAATEADFVRWPQPCIDISGSLALLPNLPCSAVLPQPATYAVAFLHYFLSNQLLIPCVSAVPAYSTMQDFHLFSNLPLELRRLIWTFSLPGPRRIIPFTTYNTSELSLEGTFTRNHTTYRDLIALQINRESRSLALRHYTNWHHAASFGYQYVDFSIDSIYFEEDAFVPKESPHVTPNSNPVVGTPTTLLKLSRADLSRVKNLDVSFTEVEGGEEVKKRLSMWISKWLGGAFTAVEVLNVLLVVERGEHWTNDRVQKVVNETKFWGDEKIGEIVRRKERQGLVWKPPLLTVEVLKE
jgi:2EXR family